MVFDAAKAPEGPKPQPEFPGLKKEAPKDTLPKYPTALAVPITTPEQPEAPKEKKERTPVIDSVLIVGDETSTDPQSTTRKDGQLDLGPGVMGRRNFVDQGQTTVGMVPKLRTALGPSITAYYNAIVQIGKNDILSTSDDAKTIFERIKAIWNLLAANHTKVFAGTIPKFDDDPEHNARREEINNMIRGTDEPLYKVIETPSAGENPKDVAKAYLTALNGGERVSFKDDIMDAPPGIPSANLGDSFTKGLDAQKAGGTYVETLKPGVTPVPGENTAQMAEKLRTDVLPSLQSRPGARKSLIIQGGAEDVLGASLKSEEDVQIAKKAITDNLEKMYRMALEGGLIVVAATLPPMMADFENKFPGDKAAQDLHYKLWNEVNDYVVKEVDDLSHSDPKYQLFECVRVNEILGTRMGRLKTEYRDSPNSEKLGPKAYKRTAGSCNYAVNQVIQGLNYIESYVAANKANKGPGSAV